MATIESAPASYVWTFPGSPIQVRVRLCVIDELQKLLNRAACPDVGTAAGCGLLLGNASRPGATEISGFEPLPALDPSTADDAKYYAHGNVVGFYRTTTKGSLCMAGDDLALARSHFHDPGSVVLLIEMDDRGPCNAVFFFWDQGQMYGDLALMEFPFDVDKLALSERMRQERIEPTKAVRGRNNFRSSPKRRMGPVLIATGGLLAVLVGYLRFNVERNSTRVPDELPVNRNLNSKAQLGLVAQRRGSDLLLYWNRDAAPVVSASFGTLVIHEREINLNITLTPEQLHSATILYAPITDHVEMRLSVISGQRVAHEAVIALLPVDHRAAASAPSMDSPPIQATAVAADAGFIRSADHDKKSSTPHRKRAR